MKLSRNIFILLILLASCSPQKRLNRLITKHPELTKDSIYTLHDTVITKAFHFDTLYNFTNTHDTIIIERKNVELKFFHNNDTVFISTQVKPDTLIKTIEIPVKRIVYKEDNRKVWVMFWAGIASVLFALIVLVIILKWIKP